MIREIALDTETTGFSFAHGDRMVEIGAVEIVNGLPTGTVFQKYINPERPVPAEAVKVHGLTYDKLKHQPKFAEIAQEFIDFVGDAPLIIHNAKFDMKFVNGELKKAGFTPLENEIIDTLLIAQKKFPGGARVTLDALCDKYKINRSGRSYHGALLDSELLAQVYLEMVIGGRERVFDFYHGSDSDADGEYEERAAGRRHDLPQRAVVQPSEAELARHEVFVGKLEKPLWQSVDQSA